MTPGPEILAEAKKTHICLVKNGGWMPIKETLQIEQVGERDIENPAKYSVQLFLSREGAMYHDFGFQTGQITRYIEQELKVSFSATKQFRTWQLGCAKEL